MSVSATYELNTTEKIMYVVSFYTKLKRNKFNVELKKILQNSNKTYDTMYYKEYELSVLESGDLPFMYYEICWEFSSNEQRKEFVKLVRTMKGYYD